MKRGLKQEWKNIIFDLAFAILTFLFVIFFYKNIPLTTILLILLALSGLIKWKSKLTIIVFFMGAISGTLAEMLAIKYHIWSYSFTNFINVPFWLFVLWGNAAAFIYQTALEIKKLGVRK